MIKTSFKNKIFNVSHFDKKINGIQYKETSDFIEYRVDVFRSVPLFLYKDKSNNIFLFDDMDYFNKNKTFKKEIDVIGFWEIILFGSSLWSRTLFKNLFQMPSASSLVVNKKNNTFKISRYWDFNVEIDSKITSIDIAAKKLNHQLNKIAKSLDKNIDYTIGLSGGIDSRITLSYLLKYIKKEKLNLFTYAYSKKSLEYQKAIKISNILNTKKPIFHQLSTNSYKNALSYLPRMSGGQIGINHCHVIDYLKNNLLDNQTYISNYFSDAIFGYATQISNSNEEKLQNPFNEVIENSNFLPIEIKEKIKLDSEFITKGFKLKSGISSLNEYIYITERNQKFHNYLFNIQKDFIGNSLSFFNNYDLLVLSLSIPANFKYKKRIEYYILEKYFPEISSKKIGDLSSIYFKTGNKFSSTIKSAKFKLLNRLNALFRIFFKGNFQLYNKYQTEELERVLYSSFKQELQRCCDYLYKKGVFNKNHSQFRRLPIRSNGTSQRYAIISLVNYIKGLK